MAAVPVKPDIYDSQILTCLPHCVRLHFCQICSGLLGPPVRLPGEKGFQLAESQRAQGVSLHAGIMDAIRPWAEKLKVEMPS